MMCAKWSHLARIRAKRVGLYTHWFFVHREWYSGGILFTVDVASISVSWVEQHALHIFAQTQMEP